MQSVAAPVQTAFFCGDTNPSTIHEIGKYAEVGGAVLTSHTGWNVNFLEAEPKTAFKTVGITMVPENKTACRDLMRFLGLRFEHGPLGVPFVQKHEAAFQTALQNGTLPVHDALPIIHEAFKSWNRIKTAFPIEFEHDVANAHTQTQIYAQSLIEKAQLSEFVRTNYPNVANPDNLAAVFNFNSAHWNGLSRQEKDDLVRPAWMGLDFTQQPEPSLINDFGNFVMTFVWGWLLAHNIIDPETYANRLAQSQLTFDKGGFGPKDVQFVMLSIQSLVTEDVTLEAVCQNLSEYLGGIDVFDDLEHDGMPILLFRKQRRNFNAFISIHLLRLPGVWDYFTQLGVTLHPTRYVRNIEAQFGPLLSNGFDPVQHKRLMPFVKTMQAIVSTELKLYKDAKTKANFEQALSNASLKINAKFESGTFPM